MVVDTNRGTGRQGDRTTGRQGGRGTGRQGDRTTGGLVGRGTGRQEDRRTGGLVGRRTGGQGDRTTGGQEDRRTGGQGDWWAGGYMDMWINRLVVVWIWQIFGQSDMGCPGSYPSGGAVPDDPRRDRSREAMCFTFTSSPSVLSSRTRPVSIFFLRSDETWE